MMWNHSQESGKSQDRALVGGGVDQETGRRCGDDVSSWTDGGGGR